MIVWYNVPVLNNTKHKLITALTKKAIPIERWSQMLSGTQKTKYIIMYKLPTSEAKMITQKAVVRYCQGNGSNFRSTSDFRELQKDGVQRMVQT